MKFDVNKLKEINDLDLEQVATWPFEVKSLVAMFVIVIGLVVGYYFLVQDKLPILEVAQNKEKKLSFDKQKNSIIISFSNFWGDFIRKLIKKLQSEYKFPYLRVQFCYKRFTNLWVNFQGDLTAKL